MNRLSFFALLTASLFAGSTAAFSHAELESANPPVGGTVQAAPIEITITFSEEVEPRFSGIQVLNAKGKREDQGAAHTSNGAKVLSVSVKPLAPGTYKVIWHATSVDSHKTQGTYAFTLKP